MAPVVLKSVKKTYPGGFEAVKGVDLEISDGEFVVLVGPSGCGKSTILRMVAGLEDVSHGQIAISGRVVNDIAPAQRDIAMVFQNYALYPHMSVERNMGFALKMRGVPKDEIKRRVDQAARILGINQLLDRKPRQLSGGQRQRVAVGRAIVREPKAFLFDEPLSNLDAKLRVSTRGELKSLHQRLKTTTIYVTHDQEEAMTLGDRIVVMAEGLVQQVGPPLEVYRRPVNRFVAGFIGSPPMNFVPGTILSSSAGLAFAEKLPPHASSDGPARAPAPLMVPLSGAMEGALRSHAGKDVVLGFRPQAVRDQPGSGIAPLETIVRVVEPLGDAIDAIVATLSGTELKARLSANAAVRAGAPARLGLTLDALHVFEPGEFGTNLTLGV
jgi:multiple sugar transport system ATP-binding protein